MGMVIRTAFNNQNWMDKCKNLDLPDERLFKCMKGVFNTGFRPDKNGNCVADCWESTLCTQYFWVNARGKFSEKATGNVYFVYPYVKHNKESLVLWGKTKVKKVVRDKVFFNKFKPMPPWKWVRGLSPKQILGQNWGRSTHRYIDAKTESKLLEIIKKKIRPSYKPIAAEEGKRHLRKHFLRERCHKLVSEFKMSLASFNCWICGFNFEKTYGLIGAEFIEAHHAKPISSPKKSQLTSINDFVAVCSNCHSMIHKKVPPLNWRKLKLNKN